MNNAHLFPLVGNAWRLKCKYLYGNQLFGTQCIMLDEIVYSYVSTVLLSQAWLSTEAGIYI